MSPSRSSTSRRRSSTRPRSARGLTTLISEVPDWTSLPAVTAAMGPTWPSIGARNVIRRALMTASVLDVSSSARTGIHPTATTTTSPTSALSARRLCAQRAWRARRCRCRMRRPSGPARRPSERPCRARRCGPPHPGRPIAMSRKASRSTRADRPRKRRQTALPGRQARRKPAILLSVSFPRQRKRNEPLGFPGVATSQTRRNPAPATIRHPTCSSVNALARGRMRFELPYQLAGSASHNAW